MSEESYKDKIEEMLKDQVNNHGDDDHTDMGSNLDKHRPSPPGIGFGRGYVPDGLFSNALETDAAEPKL